LLVAKADKYDHFLVKFKAAAGTDEKLSKAEFNTKFDTKENEDVLKSFFETLD